jgi:hypothetical protein
MDKSLIKTLALALLLLFASIAPAYADSGVEQDFVSRLNVSRANGGLEQLQVDNRLTQYARGHSRRMAADNDLRHSTSGQLTSIVSGWTQVGENVGRGQSASSLHSALMNSPSHRANIMGDYDSVGVGVYVSDGTVWVTQIFIRWSNRPAAPEPEPQPEPEPEPEPEPAPEPEPRPEPPPLNLEFRGDYVCWYGICHGKL